MNYFSKKLRKDEKVENRIRLICSYNNAKCEIAEGKIIDIDKTSISFIEPHKIIIKMAKYQILVIYYDSDNIFLYDRSMPINYKKLETLLKRINNKVVA